MFKVLLLVCLISTASATEVYVCSYDEDVYECKLISEKEPSEVLPTKKEKETDFDYFDEEFEF